MFDFSLRRIQIIHAISLITVCIIFIFALMAKKFNLDVLFYFHLSSIPIYIFCSFLAINRKNLEASRILFYIALNISITITSSFVGQEGGIEFMFMFALGSPFFTFSYKREKFKMVLFSLIPISLWFTLYLTNFNLITTSKVAVESASNFIYPLTIIGTLCLVTFHIMYYSYLNFVTLSSIHINRHDAVEASNAKSQFLSTMSHEIRTPLNAVIGLSHILSKDNPREDQVENIDALNYSGKILLELLNNVLDFSKMQSTSIELDNIPTDISAVVKQIKKIHEASCLKKGIVLKLKIDKNIPIVMLDIVRYNQVINNLLSNAIKFTDTGKIILRIRKRRVTKETLNLYTEIIDTGIGIPKDKKEKIWDAFTQASSTTNRIYGGTGLGLPIVKSIVEAMGSKIKVLSKEKKGSRFYFDIDLKIALEQDVHKASEKKSRNFVGKKVLLVDDNLINIMVGKQILEKEKLIVTTATDGLTAVNKIKETDFDIVLMDIQMPIMDGYTAAVEIRKHNNDIPILALSGAVFMEIKDKINESGMNGFINKPFNPRVLLDKIEEAIIY